MKDVAFKEMVSRAQWVETQIMKWYREKVDPKTRLALPKTKEYDIHCPEVGNVEVKEDRLASKTGYYAFETEDADGKPSGISVTTAGDFVLIDDKSVIFIKTVSLLFLIRESASKRLIQMGYTTKEGKRAWGYLIPVEEIAYSLYVEVVDKWF